MGEAIGIAVCQGSGDETSPGGSRGDHRFAQREVGLRRFLREGGPGEALKKEHQENASPGRDALGHPPWGVGVAPAAGARTSRPEQDQ